uniref:DNA-directed RNA polymerase II subunit RPB1-like isoform X1 n=1 Tax=Diabrotica virgifera virgifera TaxID=50390 RepID=A0A6P7GPQ2_DIAVI
MAFNITEQFIPNLDHPAAHRQARFGYIPLFGLLLANVLSNNVLAKYAPLGALRLSYDPVPWIQKQPLQIHDSNNYWNSVSNPYGPPAPVSSSETTDGTIQHVHHHHHLPTANQQQIVNINERPTEIIIGEGDEVEGTEQTENPSSPVILTDEIAPLPILRNSLEKPHHDEPVVAESKTLPVGLLAFLANSTTPVSRKVKRGTSRYSKPRKNNKYTSQKRRKSTTTTPDYYYDSYEEEEEEPTTTTTRRYQSRRKVPQQKRPIVDSYEESESSISNSYSDLSRESQDYDYESYEYTTRPPYKKKRRTTTTLKTTTNRPKRYRNKYKPRKPQKVIYHDEYDEVEYDIDRTEPSTSSTTDSLKVRHQELLLRQQESLQRQQQQLQRQQEILQRQQQQNDETTTTNPAQTTTTATTTAATTTASSTTPSTTTIITMLIEGNTTGTGNNTKNNTGYGYGPSNGYESISITYSPSGVGAGPSSVGSSVYSPPSPIYSNPSQTYGAPSPSYGPPQPTYAPPKPSYGPPSNTYGAPSTGSGFSPSVSGYYQVPFGDWYSNEVGRNSIVKKVHDIVGFDNVFKK